MDLLSAADKYGLEDLKGIWAAEIRAHLSAANVIDAILIADQFYCPDLMASAVAVCKAHVDDLKMGEDWSKLKTKPDFLLKLFEISCQ